MGVWSGCLSENVDSFLLFAWNKPFNKSSVCLPEVPPSWGVRRGWDYRVHPCTLPFPLLQILKTPQKRGFEYLAERVGFEPTMGYKPMPVFKTGAFNRSATSPKSCGAYCAAQEYRKMPLHTTPVNWHMTVELKLFKVPAGFIALIH